MLKLVRALDMPFDSVLEYYNSFKRKNEINSFTICSIVDGKDNYFKLVANSYEILYYLIDDGNPNYIIGFGSIENSGLRNYHSMLNNDGNISYGVRVTERNKGYGTLILELLLDECIKLGMNEVCISCTDDNIASKRIIEKNNAQFEKVFLSNWDKQPSSKYWIKLNTELDKLKNK